MKKTWSHIMALMLLSGAFVPSSGRADDDAPVALDLVYTADVVSVVSGGASNRLYYLDNLDLTADADLEALVGWHGARAFVYVLNNLGREPNVAAGTAQGINSIAVTRHGPRLFEAWIEQRFGKAVTARVGMYDLNSEFYATDAASLLIAPPFGIGSELASTGVNGPSIFPSSSLTARLKVEQGTAYIQAAALNATARTWGDRGGIDTHFDKGALLIVQAGYGDRLRLSAGAWTYSKRQDHAYLVDATGKPQTRKAHGAYALAQWDAGEGISLFLQGGASDGRTGPFRGGMETGFLWSQFLPGRDESALSAGLHRGWFSRGARQELRDAGVRPARAETAFELTASDRLLPHVTVQPDVQYILDPGGNRQARNVLVTTLRITADF